MARRARSLQTLLAQVDARAPHRSKASDGWIGDPAHAARASRHNPDRYGVVRAQDFTDDPAGGHDATWFAETLRLNRDPRINVVIDQFRLFSSYPTSVYPAWAWRPYTGVNAHIKHTHVDVTFDPEGDDPRPWDLTRPGEPTRPEEDDMDLKLDDRSEAVRVWQRMLNDWRGAGLVTDAHFGARTELATKEAQATIGYPVTGTVYATLLDRVRSELDERKMHVIARQHAAAAAAAGGTVNREELAKAIDAELTRLRVVREPGA